MLIVEKQLNITQARDALGNLVDDVQYQNSTYIILRHGRPTVAVVPRYVYENWKSKRQRLFGFTEQMQEASGPNDPDEIMALVLEAQEEARAETAEE